MKKNSPKIIVLYFGVLILLFLVVFNVHAVWIEPGSSPPSGNVAPPINTSGNAQIKTGPFVSGTLGVLGSGGNYNTTFQGGVQTSYITYTLPSSSTNGCLTNTGGILSWGASCGGGGMTNPMNALGDIIYGGALGAPTKLAGSAGFLKSTGAAIPGWSAVNLGGADVSGTLTYDKGGTAQNSWAKGDILYASAANTLSRLGIGGFNQVLTVSGSFLPSWQNAPSGFADPMTTSGDIIIRSGTTTTKLGIGSAGQVLTVSGGLPSWQNPTGGGSVPNGTLTGQTLRWGGAAWVADSNLFNDGTNVGIGTTTPDGKLAVSVSPAGGTSPIIGEKLDISGTMNTSSAPLTNIGLVFTVSSSRSAGTNNLQNAGINGTAMNGQLNYGALFTATAQSGSTGTVDYGLWTTSSGRNATNYGVWSQAGGVSSTNYALWGSAIGGTAWGLYIDAGNAYISGNTGIGTTTFCASCKLDVGTNGNGGIRGNYLDSSGLTCGANKILKRDTSGSSWICASNLADYTYNNFSTPAASGVTCNSVCTGICANGKVTYCAIEQLFLEFYASFGQSCIGGSGSIPAGTYMNRWQETMLAPDSSIGPVDRTCQPAAASQSDYKEWTRNVKGVCLCP